MEKIKVVFMGTPDFSVPVLEGLIDKYQVVAVVTQPDKRVGRKQLLTPSPVKKVAQSHDIPVLQPAKIRLDYQEVLDYKPDIIITCAYGQIIPKILLDAPCSGSGTITVGERIKISEKLVQNSAILQVKLLNKALNLLKKGGILIYSTCSVLQTENEAVLQTAFKRGDCELVPPELPFDLPRLPSTPNTICIPPNELYEGFFTAILRKK